MCGIVTVFSKHAPVSPERLARATQAMHHRGPDGQRQWVAPHGRVGMGHARLSIIDLTTGDQPIANENEQIHVVVNGEFYDYERIQRELEGRGHRLRTRSDSEILIHLYEEYGTACLPHLRGEFAFTLWDESNGVLFAARDRFGIKPLYYAWHEGALYLASEIKALFAAGVPARWDRESVYQDLHIVADEDRTMFHGVHQVAPGHFLLATRYQHQLVRYWDHDHPTRSAPPAPGRDAEHIEEFRHMLLEATRLRLRADVPVGCYLSGGIDSCSLLGVAASLRSDPIEAFTIAFEAGPFDESGVAEEMARLAGANFHCFRMTGDVLADHYADAVAQCETMHFNYNHVAKYLLSQKVRDEGFKVVLTGEGSDEILAGYPPFRRDFVQHSQGSDQQGVDRRMAALVDSMSQSVGRFMMPAGDALPTDGVRRMLGFVPTWIENTATRGWRTRPLLRADFAAEFGGRDPYTMFLNRIDVAGRLAGREPVNQSMYLWNKGIFPNKLLNFLADRMEMGHSIEGRVPFLDHHLVELANRMPVDMKIRDLTEKYVLREAARPYLTDTVYRRQKHPFVAPFELKGKLLDLVQDTLRGDVLTSLPFFDAGAVRDLLDRARTTADEDERGRMFSQCLMVTSACVLQERYRPAS
jgi:asparagine synthase (glutamine-hydrolysing)